MFLATLDASGECRSAVPSPPLRSCAVPGLCRLALGAAARAAPPAATLACRARRRPSSTTRTSRPATEPIDPADVFKLTPEMQAYLDEHDLLPMARSEGHAPGAHRRALQPQQAAARIRRRRRRATRREAFEARQGNCLSLVIMTGAFAKAMGLTVTFQQVTTDEMWSRTRRHVLHERPRQPAARASLRRRRRAATTASSSTRSTSCRRRRPAARAPDPGEHRAGDVHEQPRRRGAGAPARSTTPTGARARRSRLDPKFLSAYNTLGVIYLRHGDAGARRSGAARGADG